VVGLGCTGGSTLQNDNFGRRIRAVRSHNAGATKLSSRATCTPRGDQQVGATGGKAEMMPTNSGIEGARSRRYFSHFSRSPELPLPREPGQPWSRKLHPLHGQRREWRCAERHPAAVHGQKSLQ